MKPPHIAIFTHMAAGHVYPAVALCSELVGRGHHVTYPANKRFSSRIREAGATALDHEPLQIPAMRNAELTTEHSSDQ